MTEGFVPDDLRQTTVVLTEFRGAVRRMLALPRERLTDPVEESESRPTGNERRGHPGHGIEATAETSVMVQFLQRDDRVGEQLCLLSRNLKAVFPVEDAGSFASLLQKLDNLPST